MAQCIAITTEFLHVHAVHVFVFPVPFLPQSPSLSPSRFYPQFPRPCPRPHLPHPLTKLNEFVVIILASDSDEEPDLQHYEIQETPPFLPRVASLA